MSYTRGCTNTCPQVHTLKVQSTLQSETPYRCRIDKNRRLCSTPTQPNHHRLRSYCSLKANSNGALGENWSKPPRRHGLGCLRSSVESHTRTLHATSTVSILQWSTRLQRPAVRIQPLLKAVPMPVTRRCLLADSSQSLRRIRSDSTCAVPLHLTTSKRHSYVHLMDGYQKNRSVAPSHGSQGS
jgi:hypothetical protein